MIQIIHKYALMKNKKEKVMTMKSVDAATLKGWLENDEAIVIDVREPAEHSAERIKKATLIPLGTINKNKLPETHGKKIVVHCRSGKRSASACMKLLGEDPSLDIYNLDGGISAWGAAGYEVASSGGFTLPLERQVKLGAGIMILTFSTLGYLYSPAWFFATGFVGAGLTVAGITGFCGLSRILAKMPWNQP
jgi:rhodanese-related sulfurtransferase